MPARSATRAPAIIAGAQAEIAQLQALEDKLKGKDTYWANQIEVQRLGAAGILAHVQGDDKKAVDLVRAAADLEATMDKHPATPSPVLPARELLADLLLELNQPAAALTDTRRFCRPTPTASAASWARRAPPSRRATPQLRTTPIRSS